jgi:hypothetical protein
VQPFPSWETFTNSIVNKNLYFFSYLVGKFSAGLLYCSILLTTICSIQLYSSVIEELGRDVPIAHTREAREGLPLLTV